MLLINFRKSTAVISTVLPLSDSTQSANSEASLRNSIASGSPPPPPLSVPIDVAGDWGTGVIGGEVLDSRWVSAQLTKNGTIKRIKTNLIGGHINLITSSKASASKGPCCSER